LNELAGSSSVSTCRGISIFLRIHYLIFVHLIILLDPLKN
jgi:hypothetical protein